MEFRNLYQLLTATYHNYEVNLSVIILHSYDNILHHSYCRASNTAFKNVSCKIPFDDITPVTVLSKHRPFEKSNFLPNKSVTFPPASVIKCSPGA